MADANLINISIQPSGKLAEFFRDIVSPNIYKRMVQAKAYEIEAISKAETSAELQRFDDVTKYYDRLPEGKKEQFIRAQLRICNNIIFEQQNIDNIAEKSLNLLPDTISELPDTISEEKVSEEWKMRYLNYAKDISEEEAQKTWAQLLAGELEKPGTFSYRTMDVLHKMTKEEAEIFVKVAELTVSNSLFLYDDNFFKENLNIHFSDILLLKELSLIIPDSNISSNFTKIQKFAFNFDQAVLLLESPNPFDFQLKELSLSNVGVEIASLISKKYNEKYINYLIDNIKKINNSFLFYKVINFKNEGDDIIYNDNDKIFIK